jgi:broad specificity phosphatase PhoE
LSIVSALQAELDKQSSCGLVVLLRHGEREEVPADGFPLHDAPLTAVGRRAAQELGVTVGERLGLVYSSPVPRCVETSRQLVVGTGQDRRVIEDVRLGNPGAYVVDEDRAMASLRTFGFHPAAEKLGSGQCLPGFAEPDDATRILLSLAESLMRGDGEQVHFLVSHDLIIATFVARVFGRPLRVAEWPVYLDGALLRPSSCGVEITYGELRTSVPATVRLPET